MGVEGPSSAPLAAAATPSSPSPSAPHPHVSPISQLIFFHKAIKAELDEFHRSAVALTRGAGEEALAFLRRYRFIRAVYKYHSWAEDEVVFPALDSRVKNVANAYTLEHQIESSLFDQLSALLSTLEQQESLGKEFQSQLACCAEALSTVLAQHLAKEEEHVFPLLRQHFSSREQGLLMWDFLSSLPVKLLAECLPWVASHLCDQEQREMAYLMRVIVPKENLVQQLISGWMRQVPKLEPLLDWSLSDLDDASPFPWGSPVPRLPPSTLAHHEATRGAHPSPGRASEPLADLRECPIDEVVRWHDAMRKELGIFQEELRELERDDVSVDALSSFEERLRFLSSICQFHSIAEDEIVFPALVGPSGGPSPSLTLAHSEDQERFSALSEMLSRVSEGRGQHPSSPGKQQQHKMLKELRQAASALATSVLEHLRQEEEQVLPLLRRHCSVPEQRSLVFQSLLVMPLSLLEVVLPWLHRHLAGEEAEQAIRNMQMAAPDVDNALVKLLTQWCAPSIPPAQNCKGSIGSAEGEWSRGREGDTCSVGPQGREGEGREEEKSAQAGREESGEGEKGMLDKSASTGRGGARLSTEDPQPRKRVRMLRGLSLTYRVEETQPSPGSEREGHSPALRGTGKGEVREGGGEKGGSSPRGVRGVGREKVMENEGDVVAASAARMGLFWDSGGVDTSSSLPGEGPIDAIFSFHQALRKELDQLCASSLSLGSCSGPSLRSFSGRFHFMWGLYRAHSNAEDSIVFPALEAKEALSNVSHSYSIDHKQEEELFSDIAQVLGELGEVVVEVGRREEGQGPPPEEQAEGNREATDTEGARHEGSLEVARPEASDAESARGASSLDYLHSRWRSLSSKLSRMCLSVRLALDQHVSREEAELWPLFQIHFTTEEQDRIVGRIIGTTGAEVLQAMLTWITAALSAKEQQATMDAWRQATRNTMFEEWLSNWWDQGGEGGAGTEGRRGGGGEGEQEKDPLQAVADYFGDEGLPEVEADCEERGAEEGGMGPEEEQRESGHGGVEERVSLSDQDHHQSHGGVQALGPPPPVPLAPSQTAFKSGWHNMFRMNQKQLEAAVRRVSQDSRLDPRRKAYLMQNLMTSRWIVAQQKGAPGSPENDHSEEDRCPSYAPGAPGVFGCEHYQRNCKLKAECCGRLFPCRFCHDKVSDHTMERQDVTEMMCMRCLKVQPVAQTCSTPACQGFSMAKYFCSICKMLDNARDIYHCPFCNLCRVGRGLGLDYFHCMTCNACMSISLSEHRCRERGMESNCPICHDFLFTSATPVRALPCGHFMHSACFQAYTFEHYTCPVCAKSVGDMSVYFGMLDALLASEQLPEEYRGKKQAILCNDCGKCGEAGFHWLYHKCSSCGSYNTKAT